MTITEFLEARIAEDAEAAYHASGLLGMETPWWTYATLTAVFERLTKADAMHIARHDPARVLRECEAKRAIINMHRPGDGVQRMAYGEIYPCTECGDVDDSPCEFPCPTVKALAAVYSDHADYQQGWAP